MFINKEDENLRLAIKSILPGQLQDVVAMSQAAMRRYVGDDTQLFQNIVDRDGDWPAHERKLSALCADLVAHLVLMDDEWRAAYRRDVQVRMLSHPITERKSRRGSRDKMFARRTI